MVPSYDFDIQWLIPREFEADPAIVKLLSDVGLNRNSRGNYIALFRDPLVIAMIERADPVLREYLKASGFGFIAYESGAPAGFFPAVDKVARADVITRLDDNLARFKLQGVDLGGFDFGLFLRAITEAAPLPTNDPGRGRVTVPADMPQPDPGFLASTTGSANLTGRSRVLPLMVLALGATLGVYWLIQQFAASPSAF